MIPKIIHYCWFGGNPIPEKDQKCIDSWKKYCPDYKIIRWDESNYDITKNHYMKEAYDAKKWGFVPDYARLDIIYENGGIYLDTDVELVKNLDDLFENHGFMGFEDHKCVNPGLGFGAEKNSPMIKNIMDSIYESRHFIKEDGSSDLTPSPQINTYYLVSKGLSITDQMQNINGLTIYPTEYFCPKSFVTGNIVLTKNSYSIHHFNMSWINSFDKKWFLREQKLTVAVGKKAAHIIVRFCSFPGRVVRKIKTIGFKSTIKIIISRIIKR